MESTENLERKKQQESRQPLSFSDRVYVMQSYTLIEKLYWLKSYAARNCHVYLSFEVSYQKYID